MIGCQYVHKQSQDFRLYWNRIFQADFLSDLSKNMTKIQLCKFKQSFENFNMLTVHKGSEKRLFTHLSDHCFADYDFRNKFLWSSSFSWKYFKFYLYFVNAAKNWTNIFSLRDKFISVVALDTRFIGERILFVRCQYENKQSQDFRYY